MARKSTAKSKMELSMPAEARIEQLLAAFSWTNEEMLEAMLKEADFIHCISDDNERAARAKSKNLDEVPAFNKVARQRLQEHIRSVRHKWDKRMEDIEEISHALGEGSAFALDDVPHEPINRFQIDNGPIDNIFGDGLTPGIFGPVLGKTYLLGGGEGVGKTRLSIDFAGKISDPDRDDIGDLMEDHDRDTAVIYFQNEVPIATYKVWAEGKIKPNSRVVVSDQPRLQTQLALIEKHKPLIVFVDSLHMIMECDNISGVVRTLNVYRSHALKHGYTLVLICHLNKQGDIAGSKKLPYLVDCVLHASGGFVPGQFTFGCKNKNRYGRSGTSVLCQHTNEGVVIINSEKGRTLEQSFGGPKPIVVLTPGMAKPTLDPEAINKKVKKEKAGKAAAEDDD